MSLQLLTIGNAKTKKGEPLGYLTGVLYLNPLDYDLCPMSTPGCRAACLFTAGRGRMDIVRNGRTRKTDWLLKDRESFLAALDNDLRIISMRAQKKGMKACVRLNGTSDLPWFTSAYARDLTLKYKTIQFYDYTKVLKYWRLARRDKSLKNYHVTFSASESNQAEQNMVLALGGQVAILLDNKKLELGYPVSDGDLHDLTFLQPSGYLGLKPKGKAKQDKTGFVADRRSSLDLIPTIEAA
jgi:hypothetical protein